MVRKILHIEGLTIFLAAIYLYYLLSTNWILFVVLLLVPDISMIGYVKNTRLGAITYNLVHNYALALIVSALGVLIQNNLVTSSGMILLAHVGMDRLLGFGLKYPTNFKETHLQKV
jgi:hypothetical protein